jgi:hypothetical protein
MTRKHVGACSSVVVDSSDLRLSGKLAKGALAENGCWASADQSLFLIDVRNLAVPT